MPRTFYKTIYFTLDDPADQTLLGFILALPRSRRSRILKAVLREALPAYLRRHHPELAPLDTEAVAVAVAAARRPRVAAQRPLGPPARTSPQPEPAQSAAARGHPPQTPAAPPAEGPPLPPGPDARTETERKLDQLLRAWTR